MHPKSDVKFNKKSFDILKRTVKNISRSKKEKENNPRFATSLPEVIGIKLTNRCNLRCKHCFQWNEAGYHRQMDKAEQKNEISIEMMKKIWDETSPVKSRVYVWGGEPLFHSQFDEIAGIMAAEPREISLCTNGLLIDKSLEHIIKMSPTLELLIGIEGFEEEHDAIRGKGTYKKVIANIASLLELRKQGVFEGKISIHTVINDNILDKLYPLAEYFEGLGVDMVLFCFPWYISEKTSSMMGEYYNSHFGWLQTLENGKERSWDAFKYRIEDKNTGNLLEEIKKLNERVWKMRIRYQPALEYSEINDFIIGNERPGQKKSKCLALSMRMDVAPDGSVLACKYFSEFTVGNLHNCSVAELWGSDRFGKVRETIDAGLMPVCSKCNALYLHGV